MRRIAFLALGILWIGVVMARAEEKKSPALSFTMKSLSGQDIDLSKYQGKVILVVNVASRCGNTPQYKELEMLHEKFAAQGFAVLGFPCNQFGKQEPGTDADIATFCQTKYKVGFDMFSKVDVNGENAAPFFKYLTKTNTQPKGAGPVSWNFEKFVINRKGEVVARFTPKTKPDAPEVMKVIEAELAKK